MYHYVRKEDQNLPHFKYLHIEDFRSQLDYFGQEFGFVKKEEFLNSFEIGPKPKGVVLTFDDGLSDHYEYVLPELLKRNLWGIFYVSSGPYGNKKLLGAHRIHMLLGKFDNKVVLKATMKIVRPEMLTFENKEEFRNNTYKDLKDDEISLYLKRVLNYYVSEEYREKVLDILMQNFFPKQEGELVDDFYLKAEQIKEMQEADMIIGSHTVSHPVMSKLSLVDQKKEIRNSFKFLGDVSGGLKVRTYCHPYGGFHSFNKDTIDILEGINCLFSFNVENRDIEVSDIKKSKQFLPRYDCNLFPHGGIRVNI